MSSKKLQMDQPFKVLIDIYGVITSWDFVNVLDLYLEDNMIEFLDRHWDRNQITDFVNRLRDRTVVDRQSKPELPPIVDFDGQNKYDVIQSVIDNIHWREKHKLRTFSKDILEFYHSIWTEGYNTKKLIVHVFDDVEPAFEKWTSEDLGIKIYTFASGPTRNQRLFLSSTVVGDLNKYVTNGIRSFNNYKYDSNKFKQIVSALLERHPKNILYLTDSPKKARAAIGAGFRAIVVLRPANKNYSSEELKDLQMISSLDDLDFIIAS